MVSVDIEELADFALRIARGQGAREVAEQLEPGADILKASRALVLAYLKRRRARLDVEEVDKLAKRMLHARGAAGGLWRWACGIILSWRAYLDGEIDEPPRAAQPPA
ncbi:MAG: hypothetical protein DRJ67_01490 [Thermoprotei archaeon]|nr:MAG: hypothetical protein DRJ67_01490 [Thermoprotei archaeon]